MNAHILLMTAVAMLAFAGNSVLCRLALSSDAAGIDAASFTTIRLLSGALALALIVRLRGPKVASGGSGDWRSALALFAYAAFFRMRIGV